MSLLVSPNTLSGLTRRIIPCLDVTAGRVVKVVNFVDLIDAGDPIEIAQRYNVSLGGVPAVGDSLRDLQAADAVGALPMLVLTGKGEKTNKNNELPQGTLVFADLAEAVKHIIAEAS